MDYRRKKIRKEFYKKEISLNLFGEENEAVTKIINPIKKIADLYILNLQKVWKFVSPIPLRLNNSKGSPIFHLVFASNNKTAVNIANQIIEKN